MINIERPPYIETENPPLVVMNPQNFSLNNVEYEYYGNFDFSGISFLLRDFKAWHRSDLSRRYFNFTNVSFTKPIFEDMINKQQALFNVFE